MFAWDTVGTKDAGGNQEVKDLASGGEVWGDVAGLLVQLQREYRIRGHVLEIFCCFVSLHGSLSDAGVVFRGVAVSLGKSVPHSMDGGPEIGRSDRMR